MAYMANAQITIDFETGDMSQYTFTNDATYPWTVVGADNGSSYCIKSGNGGVAESTSAIEATYNFSAAGYISFDAKCMGEGSSTAWDKCEFSIDGEVKFSYGANGSDWNGYTYEVDAGTHTFRWAYIKDDSVDPTGDAFFVDNITFATGTPCVTPTAISVTAGPNTANISWTGLADSFTLQYKLESGSTWTSVTNITENTYTLTNIAAGTYNFRVSADCDANNWSSTTAIIPERPTSTASWYGYAIYCNNTNWMNHFINFSMQDISEATTSTGIFPDNEAAAYSNDGYVWFITRKDNGANLCKAVVDNSNKTIGNYETVVEGLESSSSGDVIEMSYNPADSRMYYIVINNNIRYLKSFSLQNPSNVTTVGNFGQNEFFAFAINNAGQAYGIARNSDSKGVLYSISLTNASTSEIGNTGINMYFAQSMSFDLETGELFWAQCHDVSSSLYKVDPATATTTYLGKIGGDDDMELCGLFMVSNNVHDGLIIDFETGDMSQYTFTNDGTYPWTVVAADNGSSYCIKSGNGGVESSTSAIEATYDFEADGYISFDAKCMGEGSSSIYDKCEFSIDGEVMFSYGENVSGWNGYAYVVETGTHTFQWNYKKDDSLNPDGDAFFVDNIIFATGTPCIAPMAISITTTPNTAAVSWNGMADSYTLQYKPESGSTWTSVTNITETTYTLTNMDAGTYDFRVSADCDADNWRSTTASIPERPASTASWYGYAASCENNNWSRHFINFSMQDILDVTTATESRFPYNYAAAYSNDGYVWFITSKSNGADLCKAMVDNRNKTIGNYVTVVEGFESSSSGSVIEMSYNPADGKMYYIVDNGTQYLKSFSPQDPSIVTTVGNFDETDFFAFAINNAGQAYGIDYQSILYSISLTDASTSEIGSTGVDIDDDVQCMSFDLETGELFWAQSQYYYGLYKVDPATAATTYLGKIGDDDDMYLSGLFMVSNNAPLPCIAPTTISVVTTTPNTAVVSWIGLADSYTLQYKPESGSTWTSVTNITENTYTLTNIDAGTYDFRVSTDCDADNWSSTTANILGEPTSTASWYGYATYCGISNWNRRFINFSMQNISEVATATESTIPQNYAATYSNDGYVWFITSKDNGANLCKAVVDNRNKTICNYETVAEGFENSSSGNVVEMSYNPADSRMYYIVWDNGNYLKSFSTQDPSDVRTVGNFDQNDFYAFAINNAGQAYGIAPNSDYIGVLYSISLTDASISEIGSTGINMYNVQSMSFDLETGELFWAQYYSSSNSGLYKVDPATATTAYLGKIGGESNMELCGLFMVSNNAPLPCITPTAISVTSEPNTAIVSWTGLSDSYTLQYKPESGSTWTSIENITETSYTLTNIDAGTYDFRVSANCDADNWSSTTARILDGPISTASWYGYAVSCGNNNWNRRFINFSMQDISEVATATESTFPYTYAAAYSNDGYVWFIIDKSYGSDLCKAIVDNRNKTIGNYVTVVEGFENSSNGNVVEMSYNPADGRMYYIVVDNGIRYLKSFSPQNPSDVTTVGIFEQAEFLAFAINNAGQAYGIVRNSDGKGVLYSINLTNASTSEIGNTRINISYEQSMSFDLETGELFWAQYYSSSNSGLYKVDPATATSAYLGKIGGNYMRLCGLFMVSDNAPQPCIAPTAISVTTAPGTAVVSWIGLSDSYTLQYKLESGSTWTSIENITETTYTLTNIDAGTYDFRVSANCDADNWSSTTASIIERPISTASWYGYATNCVTSNLYMHFINFSMQNILEVTTATESTVPKNFAAAYSNDGHVWFITSKDNGASLCKAVVDNRNKTIGNYVTVVEGFENSSSSNVVEMSYNPADGRMYYIVVDNGIRYLKSFSPQDPSDVTTVGNFDQTVFFTFAINNEGQAYGIARNSDYIGVLYRISLTDASTSEIGNTGINMNYVQSMSFDLETGELFWAQCSNDLSSLYKVDPATATTTLLGKIGGDDDMELCGLFMVGNNAPLPCIAPTAINVTSSPNTAVVSWTGLSDSYTLQYKLESGSTWTSVTNITETSYTLTNIDAGTYDFRVSSDCDAGNWSSTTAIILDRPISTANWYGYAVSCRNANWEEHFINFSMQDILDVTTATESTVPKNFAAAYSNNYVWFIKAKGYGSADLCKAAVDNDNKTIGNYETVVYGFENISSSNAVEMSYNPADGRMYYIVEDNSIRYLKSFSPQDPSDVTTVGNFDQIFRAFAINNAGEAYGIALNSNYIGVLYSISLTDASTSEIGSTGVYMYYYVQSMSFDLETGELFWAQIYDADNSGLYKVDPASATTAYLGKIGGENTMELCGLFMVSNDSGIEEENLAGEISLFPNPTNGILNITSSETISEIEIVNMMGQIVRRMEVNSDNAVCDVEDLKAGVYIVRIHAASATLSQRKFVKE